MGSAIPSHLSPILHAIPFILPGVEVHDQRGFQQAFLGGDEVAVAIDEGAQRQGQVVAEDAVAHARRAEDQPAANVQVDVQFGAPLILQPFPQHLVAHQPGVPAADLAAVIGWGNRQEQVAGPVGVGQRVAARGKGVGVERGVKGDVQFFGFEFGHG